MVACWENLQYGLGRGIVIGPKTYFGRIDLTYIVDAGCVVTVMVLDQMGSLDSSRSDRGIDFH